MQVAITTTYDKHTLRAAARSIFFDRWQPFFPWPAAWLTVLLFASAIVAYSFGGLHTTAIVLLLLTLADLFLWAIAYVWHYRRIMKLCGATVRFELDESLFRHYFHNEAGEVPWANVRRISIDACVALLFVAEGIAAIIPTSSIPEDGIALIKRKKASIDLERGRDNISTS